MKFYLNPSDSKPLLILAGLVVCASCVADELTTAQLSAGNAAQPSTKIVTDSPDASNANTYVKNPPYPETLSYVQKIAMLYKKPSHPFRDDLVKASPILTP